MISFICGNILSGYNLVIFHSGVVIAMIHTAEACDVDIIVI